MNQQKKQRLVGAIVLIALAVILIPMLLDFSRQGPAHTGEVEVPPAPDENTMQVLPLDVWSQKIEPEVDTSPILQESPTTASESSEPEAESEPKAKPEQKPGPAPSAPVVAAESAAREAPAPAAPLPRPDIAPAAQAQQPDPGLKGKAWIVQMGSFSDEAKAFQFRDRLRQMGYSCYIVPGEDSQGRRYFRVRVGPELLRSRAEALRQQLKQKTGLEGLVMRYR